MPLGKFNVVTGVSGSGKSTLVNDILGKSLMRYVYQSKERPGLHKEILGIENIDPVKYDTLKLLLKKYQGSIKIIHENQNLILSLLIPMQ